MKGSLIQKREVVGVGVPMFWPDWQDQKMRQHQTTFKPQDLALMGPERDLSMIYQRYITLKLKV